MTDNNSLSAREGETLDQFIARLKTDGPIEMSRQMRWDLIDQVKELVQEEVGEEQLRLRGRIAELEQEVARKGRTNKMLGGKIAEVSGKVKSLAADQGYLKEVLHDKQERLDDTQKERNEALRKVTQREKVITALLLPWAIVLGPMYLRTKLEELMSAVFLKMDPQAHHEVQLLMNYEMKELLSHRRTCGEVREDEDELEALKTVVRKFLGNIEKTFPKDS